jgi:hypothetical protein
MKLREIKLIQMSDDLGEDFLDDISEYDSVKSAKYSTESGFGNYEFAMVRAGSSVNYGLMKNGDELICILRLEMAGEVGYQVTMVAARRKYRGKNLASLLYLWCAYKKGMVIYSDTTQTAGSKKLWHTLWKLINGNKKYGLEMVAYDSNANEYFEVDDYGTGLKYDDGKDIYLDRDIMLVLRPAKVNEIRIINDLDRNYQRTGMDDITSDNDYESADVVKRVDQGDWIFVHSVLHNTDGGGEAIYLRDKREEDDAGNYMVVAVLLFEKFGDGYQVTLASVRDGYGKRGLATHLYKYLIENLKRPVYSDFKQTADGIRSWISLSKKYDVRGWDAKKKVSFSVVLDQSGKVFKADVDADDVKRIYGDAKPPQIYSPKQNDDVLLVINPKK